MFLDVNAGEDGGVGESRVVARRADDLVRRCYSGLHGRAFHAEVVRAIHALLPVEAVFLAAADPGTLLFTGTFAEEPLVDVADQFLANEFGVTTSTSSSRWLRALAMWRRSTPSHGVSGLTAHDLATSWRRSALVMSSALR